MRDFIVGGLAFPLDFGLLVLLTEGAGLHYTLSKIGATGAVFLYHFGLRKVLLFRRAGVG